MQKDASYHKAVVDYNQAIADAAEKHADTTDNEVVEGWCRSIGRLHRFHEKRHLKALEQVLGAEELPNNDYQNEASADLSKEEDI